MEYQKKKKQILQEVEYSNLLTFTLAENRLSKNFQSIVDAVLLLQTTTDGLQTQLQGLTSTHQKDIKNLLQKVETLEKQSKKTIVLKEQNPSVHEEQSIEDKEKTEKSEKNEKTENKIISQPEIKIVEIKSDRQTEEREEKIEEKGEEKGINLAQIFRQIEKLKKEKMDIKDGDQMKENIERMKREIDDLKLEITKLNEGKSRNSVSLKSIHNIGNGKQTDEKQTQQIENMKMDLGREFNTLHIQINSLKLCCEELKQSVCGLQNGQVKIKNKIDELQKQIKKNEEKLQQEQEQNEKKFNQIKLELMNIGEAQKKQCEENEKKKTTVQQPANVNVQQNANYKNHLNDKLSKIQSSLNSFVSESQFNRFKENVNERLNSLKQDMENMTTEFRNDLNETEKKNNKKNDKFHDIEKLIGELELKIEEKTHQCERKNNICISKYQQLKKQLQNMKEDLEFYKSMNQNQHKNVSQNSNDEKNKTVAQSIHKNNKNQKDNEELKKYFHHKLHDQRSYLVGLIRDLEKKIAANNNYDQEIVNIWEKINQINMFLNKKINEEDVKKNILYLEKKLATLYNYITSTDENNEDARVARTNWFCLSCDKNLQNYQGKIGRHIIWDSMPIKGSGLTKYFKEEKKSLPSLKR